MSRRWIFLSIGASLALLLLVGIRTESPKPASADLAVPSGQKIEFMDVVQGQRGSTGVAVRFRFVAPQIGREDGMLKFEDVERDMKYLCESYALPRIANTGSTPAHIVISLADQPIAFGTVDADTVQYFESYSIEGASCQWEAF